MAFKVPEQFRVKDGFFGTKEGSGNNGLFEVPVPKIATVLATDGIGWEHVSVSFPDKKMPTWGVMCKIKDVFWDEEDLVVQYHPPKSEHVNNHPACLHLWRPTDQTIPCPPSIAVGLKGLNVNS